jgi:hypothetical protein
LFIPDFEEEYFCFILDTKKVHLVKTFVIFFLRVGIFILQKSTWNILSECPYLLFMTKATEFETTVNVNSKHKIIRITSSHHNTRVLSPHDPGPGSHVQIQDRTQS